MSWRITADYSSASEARRIKATVARLIIQTEGTQKLHAETLLVWRPESPLNLRIDLQKGPVEGS